MTEEKKIIAHWLINLLVLLFLTIISWNFVRVQSTVDAQGGDIQKLKQESVRWGLLADDVREIKNDMKILLRK